MSYLFCCGRAAYLFLIPGPPSLLCSDERDFLFWMQSCLEPFQKTKNKTHNRLYSWQAPLTTTRSVWCACTISSEWSKKKLWKQCLRCTHSVDKQMILLQIMASASLFFSQCERSEHGIWGGAPTAGKGSDMGHCLFSSMCAIRRHECLQKHLYYGWQANNSKKISTAGDTVHIPYFAIIYLASFLKMVSHDVLDS